MICANTLFICLGSWHKLTRLSSFGRRTRKHVYLERFISTGLLYPLTQQNMTAQGHEQALDGFRHPSAVSGGDAYEHSITSSVSSSQPSIFSESSSVHSSIASSISDDFRHNHEDARDRDCARQQVQSQASFDSLKCAYGQSQADIFTKAWCPNAPSYADVTSVPKDLRQHPRRNSIVRCQKPPSLVRQDDRKVNFVESLVGKQLIIRR